MKVNVAVPPSFAKLDIVLGRVRKIGGEELMVSQTVAPVPSALQSGRGGRSVKENRAGAYSARHPTVPTCSWQDVPVVSLGLQELWLLSLRLVPLLGVLYVRLSTGFEDSAHPQWKMPLIFISVSTVDILG